MSKPEINISVFGAAGAGSKVIMGGQTSLDFLNLITQYNQDWSKQLAQKQAELQSENSDADVNVCLVQPAPAPK